MLPALILEALIFVCVLNGMEKGPSGERSSSDYILLGLMIAAFAIIDSFYVGVTHIIDYGKTGDFDWSWYRYPSGE